MKKLMQSVDRFCARHPRFGVPNLMLYIVIGNVIVWLFSLMDTTGMLLGYLAFNPYHILHGQLWRLVTFALMPQSTQLLYMVISLYFYYFIGSTLEKMWGQAKFTLYYLSGMVFTVLFGFLVYFISHRIVNVSATYINLSMFFSFATLFPDSRVLLFFFIPVKIKWLAIVDAVFFLITVVMGYQTFPANLLPVVAVLNYLLFCGGWLFDLFRPARVRQKKRTVDFQRAAKKVNRENARQGYTRKCAVCGRTDADWPDLEFRYCSRCAGYHCFCQDHINNHVHFTE